MAVEPAEAPQPQQPLLWHDAERVEHGIEARDVVAFRREVDVAVRVLEAKLGRVQLLEEQVDDDVHRAEARAEVARAGALHGDERIQRGTCPQCRRDRSRRTRELALRGSAPRMLPQHVFVHVAPQPGPAGIVSTPSSISGTAVVSVSRHGTSSTSTSRMRTFGIAAHHCAEMNVARWL